MNNNNIGFSLKDFIKEYGVFCRDDFDIIIKWAGYNGCQSQLIEVVSALAKSMADDYKSLQFQVKEWSYYAMNLVPSITEDTNFTTCINALRLAYFGLEGYQYIQTVDYIFTSKNITREQVADMHPMIIMKYNMLKEQYRDV